MVAGKEHNVRLVALREVRQHLVRGVRRACISANKTTGPCSREIEKYY